MGSNCNVATACSAHVGVGGLASPTPAVLADIPKAVGGFPTPHRKCPPAHVLLAAGGIPKATGGFPTRHHKQPPTHVVLAAGGIP